MHHAVLSFVVRTLWQPVLLVFSTFSIVSQSTWPLPAAADTFPVFTDFRQIEGIYEPSAAQQMPDGRIFVVEDKTEHALAIISIQGNGTFAVERLDPQAVFAPILAAPHAESPDDFEGISVDDEGFIYIITSYYPELWFMVVARRAGESSHTGRHSGARQRHQPGRMRQSGGLAGEADGPADTRRREEEKRAWGALHVSGL